MLLSSGLLSPGLYSDHLYLSFKSEVERHRNPSGIHYGAVELELLFLAFYAKYKNLLVHKELVFILTQGLFLTLFYWYNLPGSILRFLLPKSKNLFSASYLWH